MALKDSVEQAKAFAQNLTPRELKKLANKRLSDIVQAEAVRAKPRVQALEQLALSHAMCDQAADACFYLCRSLGLARQQQTPDAAPSTIGHA